MTYGFPELGDTGGLGIGYTTHKTVRRHNFKKDPLKVHVKSYKMVRVNSFFQFQVCFHDSIFYFILYTENQCISKLDKIGIFIDMKFH